MNRYDSTAINDFRKCPEYYRSRHIHGLVRFYGDAKGPLEAGDCLHKGIEAFYKPDGSLQDALGAMEAVWRPISHPLHVETGKYAWHHLKAVMEMYAEVYAKKNNKWKVVQNEQFNKVYFGDFEYCGIVDRVFTDGSIVVVADTKTSSIKRGVQNWQLSSQLRGYVSLLRRQGVEVDGAMVDHIYLDLKKKVVKEEDFHREVIMFSEAQLAAWEADLKNTVGNIGQLEAKRAADWRWPQHEQRCRDYFRDCPYLPRCSQPLPNLLDITLANGDVVSYQKEVWDPEEKASK